MYLIYALTRNIKIEYGDYELEEVIYVGQTTNLKQRLYKHKSKKFDSYKVLFECDTLQEAKEAENFYIKHYDPMFNKSLNFIGKYGTIKSLIKDFIERGEDIDVLDVSEIMDFAIRGKLKPLFSNKYSENQFYQIFKNWSNWKQFGRDNTK